MKTKLENKFLCKKLGQEIPPPDQAMPFTRIEPRPLLRLDFRGMPPMPVREIGAGRRGRGGHEDPLRVLFARVEDLEREMRDLREWQATCASRKGGAA